MTPFASRLKLELDQEYDRMCNNWFFKWHFIGDNKTTEIESFRADGKPICYGGIAYEGSATLVYWSTITRYARIKVQEYFDNCELSIREYPLSVRRDTITQTEIIINSFVGKILNKAIDVDRTLCGGGNTSPPPHNSGNWSGALNTDTRRLAEGLLAVYVHPLTEGNGKTDTISPKVPTVKLGLSGPTFSLNESIPFQIHHLWKRPIAWWKSRSTTR